MEFQTKSPDYTRNWYILVLGSWAIIFALAFLFTGISITSSIAGVFGMVPGQLVAHALHQNRIARMYELKEERWN